MYITTKFNLISITIVIALFVYLVSLRDCPNMVNADANGIHYCESKIFSYINARQSLIREIRFKVLGNLHFIQKRKLPNCEQINNFRVDRSIFDQYSIFVECPTGNIKLSLDNDYYWVKFDESFNNNNFLWDDEFISWWLLRTDPELSRATLNYWYDQQLNGGVDDGLIPRETTIDSKSYWSSSDGKVSGPFFMGSIELDLYGLNNDIDRIKSILPKLIKYFEWVETRRKFNINGIDIYWWSDWGSGMDNLDRCGENDVCSYSDLIAQQALLAKDISKLSEIAGDNHLKQKFLHETDRLTRQINENYYDEVDGFVYDLDDRGQKIKKYQTAAFLWSIYAKVFSDERANKLIMNYLMNDNKFGGMPWMTSLSRDSIYFSKEGGYWKGGVWPPLVWIGYKGLVQYGYLTEAKHVASVYLDLFGELWKEKGTVYEYYQPILVNGKLVPGKNINAKKDFYGWGIIPIGLYFDNNKLR